ncbi:MAG: hypothetical protein UR26_C0005G0037 [candidate division TM6 bacterium GW2011_GWF2_32_72]|nr:MAG: hypothetical protein UR26_C0005G0037 [candidate division TM6 bacterium GW2011_GWF2_32_72]
MYLVFLMYLLFASTFTIGKAALQFAPPFWFVGVRMIIAGLLLLGYLYFFKRKKLFLRTADWAILGSIIIFHIFLPYSAEFWALQYISAPKACLMYNLSPFISAFFSYIWFAEKMTNKKWLGLLIGFFALIPSLVATNGVNAFLFFSWAEIVMLISVVSSVYGWVLFRDLVKLRGYSPFMINGMAMLIGGIFSLSLSPMVESWKGLLPLTGNLMEFATLLGMIILIANVISYNLYGWLLHKYTASFLSFAGFLTPVFSAFFDWFITGKLSVGPSFFISVGLILLGLYIFYSEELKQGYIVKE